MRTILGIDPGVTGGFFALASDGTVKDYGNFPLIETVKENRRAKQKSKTRIEREYDRQLLHAKLSKFANSSMIDPMTVAYLEQVSSRPGEGSATSFKFGDCFGQLKMLLTALNIPVRLVMPNEWCAHIHDRRLVRADVPAKERSWIAFQKLFTFVARGTAKKTPDGIVDAALIAEFGRSRIVDDIDLWRFK